MANKRPMEQDGKRRRQNRRIEDDDDPISNLRNIIDSSSSPPQPQKKPATSIPPPVTSLPPHPPPAVVASSSGDKIDTSGIPPGFVDVYTEFYKKCNGLQCVICVEELVKEKEKISMMNICTHMFHTVCLEEWFTKKHTCPSCRSEDDSAFTVNMASNTCKIEKVNYGPGPVQVPDTSTDVATALMLQMRGLVDRLNESAGEYAMYDDDDFIDDSSVNDMGNIHAIVTLRRMMDTAPVSSRRTSRNRRNQGDTPTASTRRPRVEEPVPIPVVDTMMYVDAVGNIIENEITTNGTTTTPAMDATEQRRFIPANIGNNPRFSFMVSPDAIRRSSAPSAGIIRTVLHTSSGSGRIEADNAERGLRMSAAALHAAIDQQFDGFFASVNHG